MKNTCKHDTSILMEFLNQRAQQSAETNYGLRDRDPPSLIIKFGHHHHIVSILKV